MSAERLDLVPIERDLIPYEEIGWKMVPSSPSRLIAYDDHFLRMHGIDPRRFGRGVFGRRLDLRALAHSLGSAAIGLFRRTARRSQGTEDQARGL